jgi:hypothetical protein
MSRTDDAGLACAPDNAEMGDWRPQSRGGAYPSLMHCHSTKLSILELEICRPRCPVDPAWLASDFESKNHALRLLN